ncbi:hypothetical protein OH77DRAFT_1428842 [Trametes cingulata]|nr:hypothetical protein OH77DRAFT_1428842 [Trametes cingulata]
MIHNGYEVWLCDHHGKRFSEYGITILDGQKEAVCYVASEAGAQFKIQWKDHNGVHPSGMRCLIDGFPAGLSICMPNGRGQRVGEFVSEESVKPYAFDHTLTTATEDHRLSNLAAPLENIGTIEVRVIPVHVRDKHVPFKPSIFAGIGPWVVSERSKRVGVHCVRLGNATKGRCQQREITALNPRAGPLVTFIFRYEPPAVLLARGMISSSAINDAASSAAGLAVVDEPHGVGSPRSGKCKVKTEGD